MWEYITLHTSVLLRYGTLLKTLWVVVVVVGAVENWLYGQSGKARVAPGWLFDTCASCTNEDFGLGVFAQFALSDGTESQANNLFPTTLPFGAFIGSSFYRMYFLGSCALQSLYILMNKHALPHSMSKVNWETRTKSLQGFFGYNVAPPLRVLYADDAQLAELGLDCWFYGLSWFCCSRG